MVVGVSEAPRSHEIIQVTRALVISFTCRSDHPGTTLTFYHHKGVACILISGCEFPERESKQRRKEEREKNERSQGSRKRRVQADIHFYADLVQVILEHQRTIILCSQLIERSVIV